MDMKWWTWPVLCGVLVGLLLVMAYWHGRSVNIRTDTSTTVPVDNMDPTNHLIFSIANQKWITDDDAQFIIEVARNEAESVAHRCSALGATQMCLLYSEMKPEVRGQLMDLLTDSLTDKRPRIRRSAEVMLTTMETKE